MKTITFGIFVSSAVALSCSQAVRPAVPPAPAAAKPDGVARPAPVKVFLDTDLVWDPGDVSAMTFAHGLADRCEIELIGISCVTTASSAAPAADAINTYFGRPDIPIGVLKGGSFLDRNGFTKPIVDKYPPTRYKSSADAPDATKVFREVLAKQPDGSVTVVSIGPLRNLAKFLKSPADDASPLSGKELIAKKVKLLSAMAGVFVDIAPFGGRLEKEWNVEQDVGAAADVAEGWPTPIMWSGFEIGWYACPDAETLKKTDPNGPMGIALKGADPTPCQEGNGRPGWDQTSILYAARGLNTLFLGDLKGKVTIDRGSGKSTWSAAGDRQQGILTSVGITSHVDAAANFAKARATLQKAMSEIEAQAGISGMCKARKK